MYLIAREGPSVLSVNLKIRANLFNQRHPCANILQVKRTK